MKGRNRFGKKHFCEREFLRLAAIASVVIALVACAGPAAPETEAPTEAPAEVPTEAPAEVPTEATAEAPTEAPEEAVTVRFMCWSEAIGTGNVVRDELIPRFEELHPNIHVEYEALPGADYWVKLGTLAASGDMPDVYCNSEARIAEHAIQGLPLDLQAMFERDLDEDDYFQLPPELRYPVGEGGLYAFPYRWVSGFLYYNKSLFDEAGLSYPDETWTYDDVLQAAIQLTKDTDGDGEVDQWGVLAGMDYVMLDALIKANGGRVVDDDYRKCLLTEPETLKSVQWVVDLVQEHGVSPTPAQAQMFAEGVFASGKLGMQIYGTWLVSPFSQIETFEWDVTLQPMGEVTRVTYFGVDNIAISAGTSYPEEGWELLKFIISDEIQSRPDLIGLGSMPILKEAGLSEAWSQFEGQPGNVYQTFLDSAPYGMSPDFGPQWFEWRWTKGKAELEVALLGEASAEEAAASACAAIDAVLETIEWPTD
jgi:multiple sugar transport system substrate-binding protein